MQNLLLTGLATPDSGWIIFWVIAVAVGFFVADATRSSLKRRAAAGDHVVESDRDVAVPNHCARCGRPHPAESIRVWPAVRGMGPFGFLDARVRKEYYFRYCEACAAPIRRRRRIAAVLNRVGHSILVVYAANMVIGVLIKTVTGNLPEASFVIYLFGAPFFVLIGIPATIIGQRLNLYSPGVRILETGAPTVMFVFTNQIYRNHFAELNGLPLLQKESVEEAEPIA